LSTAVFTERTGHAYIVGKHDDASRFNRKALSMASTAAIQIVEEVIDEDVDIQLEIQATMADRVDAVLKKLLGFN
jgi:hypothetical protein